jgi:hypothetical protein
MKLIGQITIIAILSVLLLGFILGLTWIIQGNDFFIYKAFAPKYEDARRETFEHSKAYRQGMIQDLENLHVEYIQANTEQRKALSGIILHRAADFKGPMPLDLSGFLNDLKSERFSSTKP